MFNIYFPNTYFFEKKRRFRNSQFNFSEFQQLKNKYAKYILCCALVIVTQCSNVNKMLIQSLIYYYDNVVTHCDHCIIMSLNHHIND
jgi:hypothetical protein